MSPSDKQIKPTLPSIFLEDFPKPISDSVKAIDYHFPEAQATPSSMMQLRKNVIDLLHKLSLLHYQIQKGIHSKTNILYHFSQQALLKLENHKEEIGDTSLVVLAGMAILSPIALHHQEQKNALEIPKEVLTQIQKIDPTVTNQAILTSEFRKQLPEVAQIIKELQNDENEAMLNYFVHNTIYITDTTGLIDIKSNFATVAQSLREEQGFKKN